MFANKPAMAKRWADETPDFKALPKHVNQRKIRREAILRKMRG
jgi:hypothetical protein